MTTPPLAPRPRRHSPRALRAAGRRPFAGVTAGSAVASLGAPVAACPPEASLPGAGAASRLPAPDSGALRAALDGLARQGGTYAQLRVSGTAGRWYGVAGVADPRTGRAAGLNDAFRAGAVTEAFVATAVLQLVAEGRLRMADAVRDVLPELLPAGFGGVTVAHLLTHTSGLAGREDVPHRAGRRTPAGLVAAATRAPLAWVPGRVQEYHPVNYVLAGLLIERLTGRRYGDEIRDRLLRPLGLRRTTFPSSWGGERRLNGPHARGLVARADGSLADVTEYDSSGVWAAGEMVSTTGDLHRFLAALCSDALLPEELGRLTRTPPAHVRTPDGGPALRGAGLRAVTVDGVTFWGATGTAPGYAAGMFATAGQQRRLVWSFGRTDPGAGAAAERVLAAGLSRHRVR